MRKFLFFIFIYFPILILNSQDNTTDLKNIITGKIKRTFFSWNIEFKYNDKSINGNFSAISSNKGSKYDFSIRLNIFDKKYEGFIKDQIAPSKENFYEIEILNNEADFKGEINTVYPINGYRQDNFTIMFGDKKLSGNIEYSRENYDKTITLKLGDLIISGKEITEGIFTKNYSLSFNDRKIAGKIKDNRLYYNYNFQSDDLSEEEIFIFLFIKSYFIIDEYIKDDSIVEEKDDRDEYDSPPEYFDEEKEKIKEKELD